MQPARSFITVMTSFDWPVASSITSPAPQSRAAFRSQQRAVTSSPQNSRAPARQHYLVRQNSTVDQEKRANLSQRLSI